MSEEDEKQKVESDSEENENEIEKLSKKKNQKNDENLDNQEEEDSPNNSGEDENYIVKEEPKKEKTLRGKKRKRDAKPPKNKKKKYKNPLSKYIDLEAEEDENDEEESQFEGELTDKQQKIEMEKVMNYDRSKFGKITDQNEQKFLEKIQRREEDQKYDQTEEIIDKLPTSKDPKLWLVKCKIGDEKEIVANLYHKYFYFKNKDNKDDQKDKVKIFSIISFTNLKGKIFIEAHSERDVQFAIQDMSNVNQNSIQLVPVQERPQIFEFDQTPKYDIFKNQLVRIKGGNYDGDLAKVIEVEDQMNKIHVVLVPRIFDDLKGKKGYNVAPFSKTNSFIRPRQKLFDEKYLSKEDLDYITNINEPIGQIKKFHNNKFLDGLLIKVLKSVQLDTENVSPKEEELQKLGCIIDDDGVYTDKNTKKRLIVANKSNVRFKKGDYVKIVCKDNEELNGLNAKVIESENDNNVKIKIIHDKIQAVYSLPKEQLVLIKHDFKNGDLVFAKYGSNKGKSGMIIQILETGNITVYDSISKTQFVAKNSDLIFIEDMEYDSQENEMFKIGDLVRVKNSNIVCYIIESSKYIIKVITITNELKELSVREVNKINLGKRITCIDGKGNPLDLENMVKVIKGQYKGYKGLIKSIYNRFIFLMNNEFMRTNGIFCELSENLELLGSELLTESNDKGRVNRRRIPNPIKELIGKTVHVIKGNWKGYNGILIEGNDKNIKLELIAKQKTVELPFNYINEGDINSARDNNNDTNSFTNRKLMQTPAYYINKDKWGE